MQTSYMSLDKVVELGTKARMQVELTAEPKLLFFDLERITAKPQIDKENGRIYHIYRCEIYEMTGDEKIEREIELTESQLGKVVEKLGGRNGTVKASAKRIDPNDQWKTKIFEPI